MPKELQLKGEESQEQSINLQKFLDEKDLQKFKDYMYSFSTTITEIERTCVDVLVYSAEALTIAQIRNLLTERVYYVIADILVKNANLVNDSLLIEMVDWYLKKQGDPVVLGLDYPKKISFNIHQLKEFFEDYLSLLKQLRKQGKTIVKKFLEENEFKRTMNETETARLERMRKVMSSKGITIPSGEVIKNSLEFLKTKGIVDYRIQNNVHLWFIEPKMTQAMRRLDRVEEEMKSESTSS